MSQNSSYRNRPCGYCGQNTGVQGEGEHVLPKCFYPLSADTRFQRLKIPSCGRCNDYTEADEPHARNVIAICGLDPSQERREIFKPAMRSFQRPIYGSGEAKAILSQLERQPIVNSEGTPYFKIYPLRDQRVLRVLGKIVRGLAYKRTGEAVGEEASVVLLPDPNEPEVTSCMEEVYHVPKVFTAWAFFTEAADRPDLPHSLWLLRFFDTATFCGFILPKSVPLRC
jgi:hypothetical protein